MKILSIETAGKICAVAIAEDNNLIKEKIIEDENTHSVKLMPLIDELLKETNIKISDIDLFVCDIGPGSFTGIRIGVATTKAFVDVTQKKTIGITSLESLARNIDEDGTIFTLLDARNENVYYGIFEKNKNDYFIKEIGFDNINNVIKLAKNINNNIKFVGDGCISYKNYIKNNLDNAVIILDENKHKLNAKNLAFIAYQKRNEAYDSNDLNPIYLRKSSAELIKK